MPVSLPGGGYNIHSAIDQLTQQLQGANPAYNINYEMMNVGGEEFARTVVTGPKYRDKPITMDLSLGGRNPLGQHSLRLRNLSGSHYEIGGLVTGQYDAPAKQVNLGIYDPTQHLGHMIRGSFKMAQGDPMASFTNSVQTGQYELDLPGFGPVAGKTLLSHHSTSEAASNYYGSGYSFAVPQGTLYTHQQKIVSEMEGLLSDRNFTSPDPVRKNISELGWAGLGLSTERIDSSNMGASSYFSRIKAGFPNEVDLATGQAYSYRGENVSKYSKQRNVLHGFREQASRFFARDEGGNYRNLMPQEITGGETSQLLKASGYWPGETQRRTVVRKPELIGQIPFYSGAKMLLGGGIYNQPGITAGYEKSSVQHIPMETYQDLANMRFEMTEGIQGTKVPAGERFRLGTMFRGEEEYPIYREPHQSDAILDDISLQIAPGMTMEGKPLSLASQGAPTDMIARSLREQPGLANVAIGQAGRDTAGLFFSLNETRLTAVSEKGMGGKAGFVQHGGYSNDRIGLVGGGRARVESINPEIKAIEPAMLSSFIGMNKGQQQSLLSKINPELGQWFGQEYAGKDQYANLMDISRQAGMVPGQLGKAMADVFTNAPDDQVGALYKEFGIARAQDQFVPAGVMPKSSLQYWAGEYETVAKERGLSYSNYIKDVDGVGYAHMDIDGQTVARARVAQDERFYNVETYMKGGLVMPTVSTLTQEHRHKKLQMNIEAQMAMRTQFPRASAALGLSPSATMHDRVRDPAKRAWQQSEAVYSFNKARSEGDPRIHARAQYIGADQALDRAAQLMGIEAEGEISDYQMIQRLAGEKGDWAPMQFSSSSKMLESPSAALALMGQPQFWEDRTKISQRWMGSYRQMLQEEAAGGEVMPTKMDEWRSGILSGKLSNVAKNLFTQEAPGGGGGYMTHPQVEPGQAIVTDAGVRSYMRSKGLSGDKHFRQLKQYMDRSSKKGKGLPWAAARYPQPGTGETLRILEGMTVEEAGRRGIRIDQDTLANQEVSMLMGPDFAAASMGDYDVDPFMYTEMFASKVDNKGNLRIGIPNDRELQAQMAMTAEQHAASVDRALTNMVGPWSSELNVNRESIRDQLDLMGLGGEATPIAHRRGKMVDTNLIQDAFRQERISNVGRGTSYNLNRDLAAAMTAVGMGDKAVADASTRGASLFQSALDTLKGPDGTPYDLSEMEKFHSSVQMRERRSGGFEMGYYSGGTWQGLYQGGHGADQNLSNMMNKLGMAAGMSRYTQNETLGFMFGRDKEHAAEITKSISGFDLKSQAGLQARGLAMSKITRGLSPEETPIAVGMMGRAAMKLRDKGAAGFTQFTVPWGGSRMTPEQLLQDPAVGGFAVLSKLTRANEVIPLGEQDVLEDVYQRTQGALSLVGVGATSHRPASTSLSKLALAKKAYDRSHQLTPYVQPDDWELVDNPDGTQSWQETGGAAAGGGAGGGRRSENQTAMPVGGGGDGDGGGIPVNITFGGRPLPPERGIPRLKAAANRVLEFMNRPEYKRLARLTRSGQLGTGYAGQTVETRLTNMLKGGSSRMRAELGGLYPAVAEMEGVHRQVSGAWGDLEEYGSHLSAEQRQAMTSFFQGEEFGEVVSEVMPVSSAMKRARGNITPAYAVEGAGRMREERTTNVMRQYLNKFGWEGDQVSPESKRFVETHSDVFGAARRIQTEAEKSGAQVSPVYGAASEIASAHGQRATPFGKVIAESDTLAANFKKLNEQLPELLDTMEHGTRRERRAAGQRFGEWKKDFKVAQARSKLQGVQRRIEEAGDSLDLDDVAAGQLRGEEADAQMGLAGALSARDGLGRRGMAGWGQFAKSTLGGFGMFYLSRVMGWGQQQFQKGYGPGREVMAGAYGASSQFFQTYDQRFFDREAEVKKAQAAAGGLTAGYMRQIQAGAGDLGGIGLTGAGGALALPYVASKAAAAGILGGEFGMAGALAGPLGLGIGGLVLGGGAAMISQAAYASDPSATTISATQSLVRAKRAEAQGGFFGQLAGVGARADAWWKTMALPDAEIDSAVASSFVTSYQKGQPIDSARLAQEGRMPSFLAGASQLAEFAGYDPGVSMPAIARFTQAGYGIEQTTRFLDVQAGGLPVDKAAASLAGLMGQGPVGTRDMTQFMVESGLLGTEMHGADGLTPALAGASPEYVAAATAGGNFLSQLQGGGLLTQGMTPSRLTAYAANIGKYQQTPGWDLTAAGFRNQGLMAQMGITDYTMQAGTRVHDAGAMAQQNFEFQRAQQVGGFQQGLIGRGFGAGAVTGMANEMFGLSNAAFTNMQAMLQPGSLQNQQYLMGTGQSNLVTQDVNMQGQLTGRNLWQTSLRRGNISPESSAASIWGADWREGDGGVRDAAVSGFTDYTGDTLYGVQAMQSYISDLQYQQQSAQMNIQSKQMDLTWAFTTGQGLGAYKGTINPQTGKKFGFNAGAPSWNIKNVGSFEAEGGGFWGYQDAFRSLGYAQQEYGFDMQKRQMEMQSSQFNQNMGLQARGMSMSRDFAQTQWSFQDQIRTLQRAWQVEDFGEEVRFLTGRDRKKAERGFERSTIMYNVQGEQIDSQREHQRELWQLEDERFKTQKEHYEQNKRLQQEQHKVTVRFFEERKRLEDEQNKLQRAYATEQMKLQRESLKVQQSYSAKIREANRDLQKLMETRDDEIAAAKTYMSLSEDWIDTTEDGLERLVELARELAGELGISTKTSSISPAAADGGSYGAKGTYMKRALGGYVPAGQPALVNDREVFSPAMSGHVVPIENIDPWNKSVLTNEERQGKEGGGSKEINIFIGGEKIASLVIDAMNRVLES